MKKTVLFSLLGLLVGLTSCQKDETPSGGQGSTSTLTVTIPQGISTRAAADYGNGAQINRCILEIYRDGKLYGERQVQSVSGSQVTFSGLKLVASQTYDFVLWADCGDGTADKYYNTANLSAVTMKKAYTGNDDGFDAFFAKETFKVESSFSEEITLKRPFGQLVVKTSDLASIQQEDLKPTDVTVSFTSVPTTFNVLTGEASQPEAVNYTVGIEDVATGELTVDYILATPEQAELADFSMTFLKDGAAITTNDNFRNIPIRRNYRTNVSGNLITKQGELQVTIDSDWADDEISVENKEVTAAELPNLLSSLAVNGIVDYNITVIDPIPSGASYTLPALQEGSSIAIALMGAQGAVTFGRTDFTGTLELTNTSSTYIEININVPNGDAVLGSGRWNVASVSTKPGTLTVASGANVSSLKVKAGNVDIQQGATVSKVGRTADNGDDQTLVTLFDGATEPTIEGEGIVMQEGVTGQIVNKMTGKSYATIRDAVVVASAGDVIELAAGSYDLGEPGQVDASGPYGYYLKIETPVTLLGKEDGVTVTTSHDANSGMGSLQNLVTVKASDVTVENITFVANYNSYYGGPNKVFEVQAPNFVAKNCRFETNSQAAEDGGSAVYFSQKADNGLVEGCTINYATVSFDGLMSGHFLVKNNTFNHGNSNFILTTPNWTSNDVSTSTMKVDVVGNTINDVEAYTGSNNPAVRVSYGVVNLTDNTFPTDGVYWKSMAAGGVKNSFGAVYVNYQSVVDQVWFKDRTEPKSFAVSNNVIEMETMTAPSNNWYSWHGRKALVNLGAKNTWSVETTLTIPELTRPVRQSVWLNVCDAAGVNKDWAIVGYKIEEEGQAGFFETWDSSGEGAWNPVSLESLNLQPGDQATIRFVFDNGTVTESINGVQVNQYSVEGLNASMLKEVIYNSYSYGESYMTTWTYPVVK